ncbi:thermonuclease family protein [Oryzomonas sagensis]|uniref:Thermonuclease family protein n=1 Tax=Oryzomonas sagensis TaxID=2603857 RepID=A0ABQ6TQM4_9BACT|nr:thermonuclease family protein [Oryzomonas sagensis]KAB0671328.1 thermonuclease family protein [Oryzomonas sagensis]
MKRFFTVLALFLSVGADAHAGRIIDGMVRAVYDGDTVLLATREDSRLKVRLYGIDAPETTKPDSPGQPFGEISRRTLMYKIMGRQVSVEVMDVDQYRRTVAVIRYGGRDINRDMVAEGMAWAYRQYLQGPYASEYIGVEELARARHKGLWRDANPQPPWEFRHAREGSGRRRGRR